MVIVNSPYFFTCKCDGVYSNLMKTSIGEELASKYEFSFCHQCKKFHVNMEDGLCELCQKILS